MRQGILYIHGKGGHAAEADHYRTLFPEADVVGLDYRSETPWDAQEEFARFYDSFCSDHEAVSVIANSIGAYFLMHALGGRRMEQAYFISPIVNMERLILDMMQWANVTERELKERGCIETAFGETLSWDYLCWVRNHPVSWRVPTRILYGSRDHLQSIGTIQAFAGQTGAEVTVMENGEHWFHTEEQMTFFGSLDHPVNPGPQTVE
ncbi:MAG: alpha/beta hydrolase [Clostridiales bacterium]|nr:alpha/beta hydrolase [Clostridiales bacterium]